MSIEQKYPNAAHFGLKVDHGNKLMLMGFTETFVIYFTANSFERGPRPTPFKCLADLPQHTWPEGILR